MPLDPTVLVPKLAVFGGQYQREVLLPALRNVAGLPENADREIVRRALASPLVSAQAMYKVFVFERAGAGQGGYGQRCCDLLTAKPARQTEAQFWQAFRRSCAKDRVGVNEKLNKGVVTGTFRQHFTAGVTEGWMHRLGTRIQDGRRVMPSYMEMLSVRGIGPKIAAFICRDLAWLFDCEAALPVSERVLLQPVDTWVRQTARLLWPDLKQADNATADTAVATSIVTATEATGTSGIAFNQGAWYFGSGFAGNERPLEDALDKLQGEKS